MKSKSELCLDCLECCKVIGWYVNSTDIHMAAFYLARGCKLYKYNDSILLVTLPHICEQLGEEGCKIYESRPLICRMYDGRNDPCMKGKCLWNLLPGE